MDFTILTTENFEKEYKKLLKKYPTLKQTFQTMVQNLKSGITQNAKALPGFSHKVYKVRLGDKQKGKRGGFRVIYFIQNSKNIIYLISIFSKSDKNNISNSEIVSILKRIKF